MHSLNAEKKPVNPSRANAVQNFGVKGKTMPAVPVLQQKATVNEQSGYEIENGMTMAEAVTGNTPAHGAQLKVDTGAAPVIQRVVAHRPAIGMTISYNGHNWNVTASARANPNITIARAGVAAQTINWQTAAFTIVRANTAQDHDMRQGEAAYTAAGIASPRESEILARFNAAKDQALTMIKNSALLNVQAAYQPSLNALTLADFAVSKHGPTLIGPSATQAAEWVCHWTEGTADNPRRRWKFMIDADNPEAESNQEPHVGWEVSAEARAVGAVPRVLGHVWLDYVTVARAAL